MEIVMLKKISLLIASTLTVIIGFTLYRSSFNSTQKTDSYTLNTESIIEMRPYVEERDKEFIKKQFQENSD